MAIGASFSLVYDNGRVLFVLFWGISLLLDFCDGTVARMANKISKSAFRYDHNSDLIKIYLIFIGVGLRYDDKFVWLFALTSVFSMLYFTLLNHEVAFYTKNNVSNVNNKETELEKRLRNRNQLFAWLAKHEILIKMYKNIYNALITINGQTLLIFFVFPISAKSSIIAFSYITLISLVGIRARVLFLLSTSKTIRN